MVDVVEDMEVFERFVAGNVVVEGDVDTAEDINEELVVDEVTTENGKLLEEVVARVVEDFRLGVEDVVLEIGCGSNSSANTY